MDHNRPLLLVVVPNVWMDSLDKHDQSSGATELLAQAALGNEAATKEHDKEFNGSLN